MSFQFEADALLTSQDVAKLIKMDASSIIKWSDQGRIKNFRTPGGHRRFIARDVAAFIKEHGMPMPQSLQAVAN